MANTSDFFKFTLPENGEYVDTWDQELNKNLSLIDSWAAAVDEEIKDARFGSPDLKTFLQQAHNTDGSLKATPEVVRSRSSHVYGDETQAGADFELANRLFQSDKEVYQAREGFSDLRSALARRSGKANMVLEGAMDLNGYPTWLGQTGINIQIDGSITPLIFSINGLLGRCRKLEQISISGTAGTKYLYAQFNTQGIVRIDGDSSTPGPATANGKIGSDGFKIRIFEDTTIDFTQQDVKLGDELEILGTGDNIGTYLIAEVAPGGNVNRLKIKGVFPANAQASLDYVIRDPMAVTLGFDSVKTPSATKLYIGEAAWDGSAVTSSTPLHFKDYFIGDWRAVNLASASSFTEVWNHRLMDDALQVTVQVSQTNDGTGAVEELSLTKLASTLALANTLALSNGDQTLSGALVLNGLVTLTSSAKAVWTTKQVTISNATANQFYTDFSGVARQGGYIRVVVKKLRK